MNAEPLLLPECLKESCACLGLENPEKIRKILVHLQSVQPSFDAAAEPIPAPLKGIREWVDRTLVRHQMDMGRVSVAIWFAWKLSLWKPEHATIDHYYKDGCGFSPAQGDRLRYHGAVLVALALAGISQIPTEKQARAIRNVVPDHLVGVFFRSFYDKHDRTVHYDAGATKRAAQRFTEHRLLLGRQRAAKLNGAKPAVASEVPSVSPVEDSLESILPKPASSNSSPTEVPTAPQSVNELPKLLALIVPGVSIEEFTVQCIEAEFRRIRKDIDSMDCAELPLLDGLTAKSPHHAEAIWRLFRPKMEAFLKHLLIRESRQLLKQTVKAELMEEALETSPTKPKGTEESKTKPRPPRKKQVAVDTTPELPFGPDPLAPPKSASVEEPAEAPLLNPETQSSPNPNHE